MFIHLEITKVRNLPRININKCIELFDEKIKTFTPLSANGSVTGFASGTKTSKIFTQLGMQIKLAKRQCSTLICK